MEELKLKDLLEQLNTVKNAIEKHEKSRYTSLAATAAERADMYLNDIVEPTPRHLAIAKTAIEEAGLWLARANN